MKNFSKFKEVDMNVIETADERGRKRPAIRFSKLVVPSRMRSIYWKYFGFPADEEGVIVTRDVIVCIVCKSQMIYNRNTSNLKMHLASRHKNVIKQLDLSSTDESEKCDFAVDYKDFDDNGELSKYEEIVSPLETTIDSKDISMVVSEEMCENDLSDIAIVVPDNDEIGRYNQKEVHESVESFEINDATVNFIVTDLVSPDIVEGKGFRSLVSTLSNKTLIIPNEKKLVEDIIPNMFRSYKDQLFETLMSNCITNISLSMEDWICADNVKCLSIYMHYLQNGEPVLHTKLLSSVCCTGSEDVLYWENFLDALFAEWRISYSNITAVLTAFSIEELNQALTMKNIILLPCFLSVMQSVCNDHCFQHPDVLKILTKCRQIIKFIQEEKVLLTEDYGELDEEGNEETDIHRSLTLDHPSLWLTTFYMLRNLVLRKKALVEYLQNKSFNIFLTSYEWKFIKDLIKLLEPFKTVIFTLFEEKSSLISLLKPLIWKICTSRFQTEVHDSNIVKQLKQTINTALNNVYANQNATYFVRLATLLDPRFKTFAQEDETFNCDEDLTNLLMELIEKEGSQSPQIWLQKNESKKKSTYSGINVLFGNFEVKKSTLSVEERASNEIALYKNETGALLEECPLEWWQRMNYKCPNLVRLAQNYQCVPARIIYESQNVKDYISFFYKRAALKACIVDSLLFLHVNKCLIES